MLRKDKRQIQYGPDHSIREYNFIKIIISTQHSAEVWGKVVFCIVTSDNTECETAMPDGWLVGCFEDQRRLSDLSAISRLGSRR